MPDFTIHYALKATADLRSPEQTLIAAARSALEHSFSPYSGFRVGAAARLENGEVITGWNIENAAYPMCLCAEAVVLAAAASQYPEVPILEMAITAQSKTREVTQPVSPCGSCRQQLAEHERRFGHALKLLLQGEHGPIYIFSSAGQLLPFGFSGDFL